MSDTPGLVFLEDMETKRKQPGFFRLYGKLLLLLFLILAGVVAVILITRGAQSYRSAHLEYERIRRNHVRVVENAYEADPEVQHSSPDGVVYPAHPSGAVLEIDFDALLSANPDTAAWIHIPALEISYPVVRTSDRDYYTSHTFEGKKNANGAIFIEPFNHSDFTDRNTFLYGHNASDGSMFGTLYTLLYQDTLQGKDPCIYLYAKDGTIRKYRIYSCYAAKEDSESFRTVDEETYDDYLRHTMQSAQSGTEAVFENRPDLLTLSTCYGRSGTDERFLVHAVRVP